MNVSEIAARKFPCDGHCPKDAITKKVRHTFSCPSWYQDTCEAAIREAIEECAKVAEKTGTDARARWLETKSVTNADEYATAAGNACWFAAQAIRALAQKDKDDG